MTWRRFWLAVGCLALLTALVVLAALLRYHPKWAEPVTAVAGLAAAGLTAITALRSAEAARESRLATREARRAVQLHYPPLVINAATLLRDEHGGVSVLATPPGDLRAATLKWVTADGRRFSQELTPGVTRTVPLSGVSTIRREDAETTVGLEQMEMELVKSDGARWVWTFGQAFALVSGRDMGFLIGRMQSTRLDLAPE